MHDAACLSQLRAAHLAICLANAQQASHNSTAQRDWLLDDRRALHTLSTSERVLGKPTLTCCVGCAITHKLSTFGRWQQLQHWLCCQVQYPDLQAVAAAAAASD